MHEDGKSSYFCMCMPASKEGRTSDKVEEDLKKRETRNERYKNKQPKKRKQWKTLQ